MRPVALLVTSVALASVAGCGASDAERRRGLSYGDNAHAAYAAAMEDFDDDDCLEAEPELRQVRRDFPYSRYAALAELRIADCLLMQDKQAEAIAAYRRFVRNRPSHDQIPYARYKIAEAYYKQIPSEFFLSPPAEQLDQGSTREALRQLRRFILDFPDDPRVADANHMVREALALLARHELYVADYYLGEGHPEAAVMRLETLLRSYPGSGIEPEAMLLLARVHMRMHHGDAARDVLHELIERFPRSGHAAQARRYLDER
jgi:outer membrane protein assembly factor BamD